MRQSRHFGITAKDAPRDAHTAAHRLLIRSGFIRAVSPGVHVAMPGFTRVTRRLADTARRLLDAHLFEEIDLPVAATGPLAPGCTLPPAGGRGTPVGFDPDPAQVVGTAAAKDIRSYKDLPRRLFRVVRRVDAAFAGRGAWLDGREYLALEMFGLEPDAAAADRSATFMLETAAAVCRAAGLECRSLTADPGPGPSRNHALVVPADNGDTAGLVCEACGAAALASAADARLEEFPQDADMRPMQAVHGPGLIGVGPLAEFLGIPVWKTTKTLLFGADDRVVAVMVRGDCDVDEEKVRRHLGCGELALAAPQVIQDLTGAQVGYAGGVGLPPSVRVLADRYTRERVNFECGANRTDYHNVNVNWGRDLPLPEFGDFKTARAGDRCPACDHGRWASFPSVRVGRLSVPAEAEGMPTYQDATGGSQQTVLACGALNLTRVALQCAEAHHDEAGLRWPADAAPYDVHLIGLNLEDEAVRARAEELYARLCARGAAVLFDDREARAGEKFSDADLFGIPVRLTVSKRMVKEGKVERKRRGAAESEIVTIEETLSDVGTPSAPATPA